MSNPPREDGPALQRLFQKIDGPDALASLDKGDRRPQGQVVQAIPASIAGLTGIEKGSKQTHVAYDETTGKRVEVLEAGQAAMVGQIEATEATDAGESQDAFEERMRAEGHLVERTEDGRTLIDGMVANAVEEEDFGIVNYPKFLHEAGEAAIQIVKNMVDSECAMGNPRNIPEPIMGWYLMTMIYQLCVLEVCGADIDARTEHVKQFAFARNSFKYTGQYADSVRDELSIVITKRSIPAELANEDLTYGGVLVP